MAKQTINHISETGEVTGEKVDQVGNFTATANDEIVDSFEGNIEENSGILEANIINNARNEIDKKYLEFKILLLNGDLKAFNLLSGIRSLEKQYSNIGILVDTPKTADDFLTKEDRQNFIKAYCEHPGDLDKLDFIYKLGNPSEEEKKEFIKSYCLFRAGGVYAQCDDTSNEIVSFIKKYGYILTPELAGDIFCLITEKTQSPYGIGYGFCMDMLHYKTIREGYMPITKHVAEILIERRGSPSRNGKDIGEGKEIKYVDFKKILENEDHIYIYYQHSYYGTLSLGNQKRGIPEIHSDSK